MRLLTVFFCLSILFIAGTQAAWSRHHHGFNWRRCANFNYNYRGNNWNRYRNYSGYGYGNGYFNGYGPGYGNYSGYANYSPFLRQIFRY